MKTHIIILFLFGAITTGAFAQSMKQLLADSGIQGGVNLENIVEYLKEDNIPVAGGSWLTKKELIGNKDWQAITERAAEVRRILDEAGVCN